MELIPDPRQVLVFSSGNWLFCVLCAFTLQWCVAALVSVFGSPPLVCGCGAPVYFPSADCGPVIPSLPLLALGRPSAKQNPTWTGKRDDILTIMKLQDLVCNRHSEGQRQKWKTKGGELKGRQRYCMRWIWVKNCTRSRSHNSNLNTDMKDILMSYIDHKYTSCF